MAEVASEVAEWVHAYESETMTFEQIAQRVRERLGIELDRGHLDNYWRSQDIGEFVEGLLGSVPVAAPAADDDALALIREALDLHRQFHEDPVRHADRSLARIRAIVKALDLRFRKRHGEIDRLLEAATDAEAVLAELRVETQIRL